MIAYLKREDTQKDQELDNLRQQLKDFKVESRNERDELMDKYSQEISKLETALEEKNDEVYMQLYTMYV